MTRTDHKQLARQIADAALLKGSFTLRSGQKSAYYLDKYRFTTRPEILDKLGDLFCDKIHQLQTSLNQAANRLAGAELGGIPLVTVASLKTSIPTVLVRNARKDYGTAQQLEGTLNPGDTVIILEDIATTGGQIIEAAKAIQNADASVMAIIATIDRLQGARENIEAAGYHFESLFTRDDLGITDTPPL